MEKNFNLNFNLEERDRFTFLKTWADAFEMLPNYTAKGLYAEAIINYCFYGKEPNFDTVENDKNAVENDNNLKQLKLAWLLTRDAAKYGLTKYCSGKLGGAPIGNNNAQKQPKNNQKTTKKQPKNNQKTTEKQPKNNTTLHYTTLKKEIKLPLNKENSGGGGFVFSDKNNKPTEAELTAFVKSENLEYIQPNKFYQDMEETGWKMLDGSNIQYWQRYVRSVNDGRKKDKEPIADWAKKQPKVVTQVYE